LQTWPVSSVHDTITLYTSLLGDITAGKDISYGKKGYYMAASGSQAWTDIYAAVGKALAKRGVIDDASVGEVSEANFEKAAQALGGPREFVPVQMGGM
jgi:hypothetical protein